VAILVIVTAVIFWVYLSPRRLPLKYLIPGTLFLIAFQIVPVLYTVATAFTNFGDGHRGTEQDAIVAIQTASVKQVPGSVEYNLKVAVDKNDKVVFLLTDPGGKTVEGDASGLHPDADLGSFTPLTIGAASARGQEVTALTVPTSRGAIRANGLSRAYEGVASRRYQGNCDCVMDADSGKRWIAHPSTGQFVADDGDRLPQGWKVDVGFSNFARVVTDSSVAGPFFGALAWNIGFAVASVGLTFALGMICALALHTPKMRGRPLYRLLLVLPYAMPSFAMLLVWRDMFNSDFGLINRLFGLHVDWLGSTWGARFAVILVQLWMGYPYMFLVTTGALQAIPRELTEAASVDGASRWQGFRRVTLPLLLVALSPLLIASFAFNFNNFNAIYLVTEGGPFPADNPDVGGTDLLITYTYRLAFGGQGAQYGFAAAVSIYIFAIVALISAISFRRTRKQEEVYG
jgi:arabinogalactan oligomer/maltooligosaccharide transport system permease protein